MGWVVGVVGGRTPPTSPRGPLSWPPSSAPREPQCGTASLNHARHQKLCRLPQSFRHIYQLLYAVCGWILYLLLIWWSCDQCRVVASSCADRVVFEFSYSFAIDVPLPYACRISKWLFFCSPYLIIVHTGGSSAFTSTIPVIFNRLLKRRVLNPTVLFSCVNVMRLHEDLWTDTAFFFLGNGGHI